MMKKIDPLPRVALAAKNRRPPPFHQGTLDEAIVRLGLRDITAKRMFGGLCYYVGRKAFAFVLEQALAVKLPATQLRTSCARADGRLFHPSDGEFVMREYLELSRHTLADEEKVDEYVLASYRFIAGQRPIEDDLAASDLWQGRGKLYEQAKKKT